jgi:dipeptidyl aminopeptidase/acylaminoacyl peptidase
MAPALSPEDYQRACDLFNELLEVPAGDREGKLDAACQGNAGVRAEVVRLLRAEQGAGSFLHQSALSDAARLLGGKAGGAIPESIAHYRILSKLGEGGMGEVWRAHDSKLDREVAIKILPEVFAANPDRLARFTREAQVLALLNHPHIAAIYGVEERALIMELVEGPTLAERIAAGPIPWKEAAEIACHIADALEAAHEKGVVHRDLKPANIKIGPDDRVKVLDFGLSKAMSDRAMSNRPTSGEPSSPTKLWQGSMASMIIGTAAYMAPEQAKGKAVDRRADIWAFGVVYLEMLTGRNPFQRESVPETLAAVLEGKVDLERIPAPARAVALPVIERCVRDDPRRRWQSIGDARIAIEEALAGSGLDIPKKPALALRLLWAAAGALAAALVLAILAYTLRGKPASPPPVEFTVYSPGNGSFPLLPPLRVSPNGESIVFLATDPSDQVSRVWLYDVAKGNTRGLTGTEQASDAYWSSDNHSLLLTRNGAVFRTDIHGDTPQPLPIESGYSSWGPDGVVTQTREGLSRFRPESGDARLILRNDPHGANIFIFPTLIPGSRWMLYNTFNGSPTKGVTVRMGSIEGREQKQLFAGDNCALYAGGPSGTGYALYFRGFTLNAQELDPSSGQLRGDPHPVAGPVDRLVGFPDPGAFSASNNGVLAFRRRGVTGEYRLVWYDRSGNRLGTLGGIADYTNPSISPDGNRVAVGIRDPGTAKRDIFVFDVQRGTETRVTFGGSDNTNPAWSPDGQRIAYSSDGRGARDLYVKNASGIGEPELLFESKLAKNVEDWSQDGRWLVYNEAVPNNDDDLAVLSLADRKPHEFLRTRFQEDRGRLSPDGKWMAYYSNESGQGQVCIQPFRPTGEKWQITNGGGGEPQWRGDGKELYYAAKSPPRIMAVEIAVKDRALHAGIPHLLFDVALEDQNVRNRFAVTRDGMKFLAVVRVNEKPVNSFTVIVNWPSLLPKR